ncbi:MAG: 50S ribosomal protein L9 [bacterium]|nr:50S ribosomal protein L9 [bacterium]
MKVVLTKNVPQVGNSGDICQVKDGFARHYLLPKGLAVQYGDQGSDKVLREVESRQLKKKELSEEMEKAISEIEGITLPIAARTNKKDQLFASVSEGLIKKKVNEKYGVSPDLVIGVPIKQAGSHQVELVFSNGKHASIVVVVEKDI